MTNVNGVSKFAATSFDAKKIFSEEELIAARAKFEQHVAKERHTFEQALQAGAEHIQYIQQCLATGQYVVKGQLWKGRPNEVMFILEFPDSSQVTKRYNYPKINDARAKVLELQQQFANGDWSD